MAGSTSSDPGRAPRPGSGRAARPSTSRSTRSTASRTGSSRTPARGPRTGPNRTRPAGSAQGRGPAKARPALAARPRTTEPTPPSPTTTWARAGILLAIVVMLAVTLVPTLRSVLQQRQDTAALRAQVEEAHRTVADLEREAKLWRDPAYIEQQARERLKFVRIGDRAYTVIGLNSAESRSDERDLPAVAAPIANEDSPWYGKIWQSIQIADQPTAGLHEPSSP